MQRSSQVHQCLAAVSVYHASSGAAPCEPTVQNRPDRAVWQAAIQLGLLHPGNMTIWLSSDNLYLLGAGMCFLFRQPDITSFCICALIQQVYQKSYAGNCCMSSLSWQSMVMQVQDLSYLVQAMGNDPFSQHYRRLSQGLCEVMRCSPQPSTSHHVHAVYSACSIFLLSCSLNASDVQILWSTLWHGSACKTAKLVAQVVEDFGLLHFTPLAIEDKESVQHVLSLIDKANGHVFAGLASGKNPYPPEFVYGAGLTAADTTELIDSCEEKYVNKHVEERFPAA